MPRTTAKNSSIAKRTVVIALTAAGLVAAASLVAAPFIATAAAGSDAGANSTIQGVRATLAKTEAVLDAQARDKAVTEAKATIDSANVVIASAASKVDASALQTSVGHLANYELLSVGRVEVLTAGTRTAAQQTADAVAAADAAAAQAAEAARIANTPDGARAQARELAASLHGWGADQFGCLDRLWTKESNWRVEALNPGSGATGIPQSLPGEKMATVGADYLTNARTQIIWGLGYISSAYGTPCAAWGKSQSVDWY